MAILLTQSRSLPQVTVSSQVVPLRTPGSVLPASEESAESTGQLLPLALISSSVWVTCVGSQHHPVLILSNLQETAGPSQSIQSSNLSMVGVYIHSSDMARIDHGSVASPPNSELLAVLSHQEEVVPSQNPYGAENPSPGTQDSSVSTESCPAVADCYMASRSDGGTTL